MTTKYTAIAETALVSAYMQGQPIPQHEQFEAAQAHYMAGLSVPDALAILPAETSEVFRLAHAKAMADLLDCPTDDVPLVAETIRALASGIRARAAGMLAQRDIDAAMDAVRQEMEFDNLFQQAA